MTKAQSAGNTGHRQEHSASTLYSVHCPDCQTANHFQEYTRQSSGRGDKPMVSCYVCRASFDPYWEEIQALESAVIRDEMRAEGL